MSYPLLKDMFGEEKVHLPSQITPGDSLKSITTTVEIPDDLPLFVTPKRTYGRIKKLLDNLKNFRIWLIGVVGITTLIAFIFLLWPLGKLHHETQMPPKLIQKPLSIPQGHNFNSETQTMYYQKLKNGQLIILDSLPGGWKIENEMFQNFLSDLSTVLEKTKWSIEIKVYTDQSGPTERAKRANLNQTTSDKRAKSIREALLKNQHIAPDQIVVVGLGDKDPKVQEEKAPADSGKNRRIEIKMISKDSSLNKR